MAIIIAILVTATMAGVDFCLANYTMAMGRKDDQGNPDPDVIVSGLWSVGQWGCAAVGFVVAVKLSVWYLPFEALGLFLGTVLAGRRVKRVHVSRRSQNKMPRLPEGGSGG